METNDIIKRMQSEIDAANLRINELTAVIAGRHAEISTAWWELARLKAAIPSKPEHVIALIGSRYLSVSSEPGDLADRVYSLTVLDLLAMFAEVAGAPAPVSEVPPLPAPAEQTEPCLWRLAEGDGNEIRFNAPLESDQRTWVTYYNGPQPAPSKAATESIGYDREYGELLVSWVAHPTGEKYEALATYIDSIISAAQVSGQPGAADSGSQA